MLTKKKRKSNLQMFTRMADVDPRPRGFYHNHMWRRFDAGSRRTICPEVGSFVVRNRPQHEMTFHLLNPLLVWRCMGIGNHFLLFCFLFLPNIFLCCLRWFGYFLCQKERNNESKVLFGTWSMILSSFTVILNGRCKLTVTKIL